MNTYGGEWNSGGLQAGRSGFNSRRGKEIFLYSTTSVSANPASYIMDTKEPFPVSVGSRLWNWSLKSI
jgi:hypothetical protein